MLRRSKGRKRITFRKTKARRRVSAKPRQRAFSIKQLKENAKNAAMAVKEKTASLVETMTPKELGTYRKIKERYELQVGKNSNRELSGLNSEERLMAKISRLAYKLGEQRDRVSGEQLIDGYRVVPELSDDNSVVVANGSNAIIGYRGTIPTKTADLVADYHITFGTTAESRRFREAEEKFKRVRDTAKYSDIRVTGHSLGGAQAIHIAKMFHVPCWAWNPGQGVSEQYLNETTVYPNIRTYHILGDPISDTAGLENPSAVYVFPRISVINPLANHSLDNFLD